MATVKLTAEAAGEFSNLPKGIRERVLEVFKRLDNWPAVSGVKKLQGDLKGWYRVRTGDYRILFRVQGDNVTVEKIGNRRDVYEG